MPCFVSGARNCHCERVFLDSGEANRCLSPKIGGSLSKKGQGTGGKNRVRVSSEPESSIPKVPGRAESSPASTREASGRGGNSRSRVQLDPAPVQRRLPEIPDEVSSSPSTRQSPPKKGWNSTLEVRLSTLVVFAIGFVVLLCLAVVGGRSSVPDRPLAGTGIEAPLDDQWPAMDPEPKPEPAIRNVQNAEGKPVELAASDPDNSPVAVVAEAEEDFVPIEIDQKLWAVMVGQKLSAEVEIIDQLLAYVDSGLTDAVSRIRVREKRSGIKRYDVYVGPFATKEEARKAYDQLLGLRSTLGIRFADVYITQMNFSPEELENLSPPVKNLPGLGE